MSQEDASFSEPVEAKNGEYFGGIAILLVTAEIVFIVILDTPHITGFVRTVKSLLNGKGKIYKRSFHKSKHTRKKLSSGNHRNSLKPADNCEEVNFDRTDTLSLNGID